MALHTKKAFAEMCGLTTGNLSVYEGRGKVIYSGDYVDDHIEPNSSFLKMRLEKVKCDAKTTEITEKPSPKAHYQPKKGEKPHVLAPKKVRIDAPNVQKPAENDTLYRLNTRKMETQIQKMQMEMEKLRMQNEKFMGEVIPVGLLKPSILQHNQSILTQSSITVENLTRIIVKKFNVPTEQAAEFRSKYISELNEMMRKATVLTVKSLNNIVNEFAAKKNVGQRN